MTPEEKRIAVGKMDSRLMDAYGGKGKIMTSRDSFPITDKKRTEAYLAERNRYARELGVDELCAEDYRRMAAATRIEPYRMPQAVSCKPRMDMHRGVRWPEMS